MTDFDPTQNRVPTCLLTADELAALKAAKHGWAYLNASGWNDTPGDEPSWFWRDVIRAKPEPRPTIMVNGIAVPEPVRTALADGQRYHVPVLHRPDKCASFFWYGDVNNRRLLAEGLIHRTKADAITHARAMCAPGMREGV